MEEKMVPVGSLPGAEDRAEYPGEFEERGCLDCAALFRVQYWSDRHQCDACLLRVSK